MWAVHASLGRRLFPAGELRRAAAGGSPPLALRFAGSKASPARLGGRLASWRDALQSFRGVGGGEREFFLHA